MEPSGRFTAENFAHAIAKGVALVDFTAPWGAPCRQQEPIIRKLAERFKGKALITEMNVDENPDIAVRLGIRSIPTLVIFKNGREIHRFVGLQTQDTLLSAIHETLIC